MKGVVGGRWELADANYPTPITFHTKKKLQTSGSYVFGEFVESVFVFIYRDAHSALNFCASLSTVGQYAGVVCVHQQKVFQLVSLLMVMMTRCR